MALQVASVLSPVEMSPPMRDEPRQGCCGSTAVLDPSTGVWAPVKFLDTRRASPRPPGSGWRVLPRAARRTAAVGIGQPFAVGG